MLNISIDRLKNQAVKVRIDAADEHDRLLEEKAFIRSDDVNAIAMIDKRIQKMSGIHDWAHSIVIDASKYL